MTDRINKLDLPFSELRTLVLEALKEEPATQYENLCCKVGEVAVEKSIVPDPRGGHYYGGFYYLDNADKDKVREIIWNLVIERVLTIGTDSTNAS